MALQPPDPHLHGGLAAHSDSAGTAAVSEGFARRVGPEIAVTLGFSLYDAEGELVESSNPEDAIEFIFGVGQASAEIEQSVEGLAPGQRRRLQLGPRQAFGPRDEEAVLVVERGELPADAKLGDEFEAEGEEGETVFLRVVELDEETAHLDANHPLAGQTVTLELTVLSTRVASSAEIAAAEAALAEPDAAQAPDVLLSRLLRKDRFTPPQSE
jgi:FKBP-type peptidyl-prolyl cis-trans isomerase SlyD